MVFSSKHFLFRCHLDKLTHVHQKQLPTREMQGHCALQHTKVNLLLISINDGFEIPKHIIGNQEWVCVSTMAILIQTGPTGM